MTQVAWITASPFQQADLVHVDGLAVPVDEDDDGQADAHLGRGHGDDEQGEDLSGELPASGTKTFVLRLRRGASAVWVEVFDPDLRLPRLRSAGETDEGGRGLYLVDQIATRWGSRPTRDGKSVWFELPVEGGRKRPQ